MARRDSLLILNPDCELFPGSLRTLVEALANAPAAALAGPLVVDRHGAPMRGTLRRFPDPWRSFLTFSGLWRLGRYSSVFQGIEPVGELPQEVTGGRSRFRCLHARSQGRLFRAGRHG